MYVVTCKSLVHYYKILIIVCSPVAQRHVVSAAVVVHPDVLAWKHCLFILPIKDYDNTCNFL